MLNITIVIDKSYQLLYVPFTTISCVVMYSYIYIFDVFWILNTNIIKYVQWNTFQICWCCHTPKLESFSSKNAVFYNYMAFQIADNLTLNRQTAGKSINIKRLTQSRLNAKLRRTCTSYDDTYLRCWNR